MRLEKSLIGWIGGAVTILILIGSVTMVIDGWITQAQAETEAAKAAQDVEMKLRIKAQEDHLEREKKLNEQIVAAQEAQKAALARAAESQRRERAALDRLQAIISDRDRQVGAITSRSDTELSRGVSDLSKVAYPGETRTFTVTASNTGADINRTALEVFNTSLIDVVSLREQLSVQKEVNSHLGARSMELNDALTASASEINDLNDKFASLEQSFEAFKSESLSKDHTIEALTKENKALRRKGVWTKIRTVSVAVGAVVVAVIIGKRL